MITIYTVRIVGENDPLDGKTYSFIRKYDADLFVSFIVNEKKLMAQIQIEKAYEYVGLVFKEFGYRASFTKKGYEKINEVKNEA